MADARHVVEELNRFINAHDIPAARRLFAPDAEIRLASGRILDLDGYARFLQLTYTAFPDMRVAVERWIVDGDAVVTEEVMAGTHSGEFAGLAPTGVEVQLPMVHVSTVTGDRITRLTAYHDTAGILRQLGSVDG